MGKFDKIYSYLPIWGQHTAASAYGVYRFWLRFGSGYKKFVEEYTARETYSSEAWDQWQATRLREILNIAAEKVPYYENHWAQSQKASAKAGKLADLPILEKEPIRSDPGAFLNRDIVAMRRHVFHTSGSTGTPVASMWTTMEVRNSRALREARSAKWAGVSFKLPRATFSGRMVEPDPESQGPFYRYNIFEKQVYFSAFHLRPDTAHYYINALHKHKIQWLTGYAVSYYLLAKFMIEQDLQPPPLKAVITTSEKVTPQMREVMEKAYRCKVFEEYSTVETALFASECEQGRLHVSPDVAVVEILRPDGTPCDQGEPGEIVTTCLFKTYQPLIRFRLGDIAVWDTQLCGCGRQMPVLKEVLGRIEDVVIGPDGRQMVRFHGIFIDQPNVREGQIIQEALDRIRVKVVPTNDFGEMDIDDIINRVKQRLGAEVQVTVEQVNHIPRTAAGKFQAVISRLREEGIKEAERTGLSQEM
jgi:phenylacetate-CoA ligase